MMVIDCNKYNKERIHEFIITVKNKLLKGESELLLSHRIILDNKHKRFNKINYKFN